MTARQYAHLIWVPAGEGLVLSLAIRAAAEGVFI